MILDGILCFVEQGRLIYTYTVVPFKTCVLILDTAIDWSHSVEGLRNRLANEMTYSNC